MKVPLNISGHEFISYLLSIGFQKVRQTASHDRLAADINGRPKLYHNPFAQPSQNRNLKELLRDSESLV